jgi:hypothetical protein
VEQLSKRCPSCGETKPVSDFRAEASRPRGIACYCRACEPAIRRKRYLARKDAHNDYARRYREDDPERHARYVRRHALKKLYGITPEQWDEMYETQEGRCLICGKKPRAKRLHVDHCHETGAVRGLLCSPCNSGIAHLNHDPALLARAIDYLGGRLVA